MWCIGLSSFTYGSGVSSPAERTVSEVRASDLCGLLFATGLSNSPGLTAQTGKISLQALCIATSTMRQIALYNNATSTSFEGNFARLGSNVGAYRPLTLDNRSSTFGFGNSDISEGVGLRNRVGFNENPLIGTLPLSDDNRNISSAHGLLNGEMARPSESVFFNSPAHRFSSNRPVLEVQTHQPLTLAEEKVLSKVLQYQSLTLEEEKVLSKVLAYQSLPLRDTPSAPGSSDRQRTSHVVLSDSTYDAIRYGLIIVLVICTTCIVIPKCFRRTPTLSNPPFILAPMIRKKKESADKTSFTADEFKEYLENEPIVNKPDRMILVGMDSTTSKTLANDIAIAIEREKRRVELLSIGQTDKDLEKENWEMLAERGYSPTESARLIYKGTAYENNEGVIRDLMKRISLHLNQKKKKPLEAEKNSSS
jgi:hypothetical protein